MSKPKINDWVLVGNAKVGKLREIQGKEGVVMFEMDRISISLPYPIAILTRIPKEVADVIRSSE